MEKQGFWDSNKEKELREKYYNMVLEEMDKAEVKGKTPVSQLFVDVFHDDHVPVTLRRQQESLTRHLEKHAGEYE